MKNFSNQDQIAKVYGGSPFDISSGGGFKDQNFHSVMASSNNIAFKSSIVDKYASKTRMGMIPNMKKTN
jgi:hypothetical protein